MFRGALPLNHEAGMKGYLWVRDLGLKDCGEHAEQISRRVQYLNSNKDDRQQLARCIAAANGIPADRFAL